MMKIINISEREDKNVKEETNGIFSTSLQDSIKRIIKNEGYLTHNVETRIFNTGGGNFMGQCYEVDIKGETAEGRKDTNIFVKQAITLSKIEFISVEEAYSKEVFVYTDLSKVIASLEEQAGVPQHDRYSITRAYDQTNTEALLLDNLNKRNFKTYNRLDVMPLKYAQLGVQELAKFHGLSFVIEKKMPEYFNEKIKSLHHTLTYNDDWKCLIRNICTYLANLYNDNTKSKIENFLPYFLEKYPKRNGYNATVKCCLTHGDYRINNVLVREHNGEPVEVMPLDYQLIDYGCPIRDFLFFIFSGTDREFRRQHLDDLKNLYFDTLSRFLKYFDMDVETVFPREEFERVYTEWLDYGLMIVLFNSVFLYAPDTGLDMVNLKLSELPYCPNQYIKERLKELIDDFVHWGYL